MEFKSLRKSLSKDEWEKVASLSGTSTQYLTQIALNFRRPSVGLAERIENAINQVRPGAVVTKEGLVFAPLRQHKNKRSSPKEV
ncbi:transcriptional regulator [Salmonella enterica]|uniref:Transcriptional regulator n=1 Tax=Salmonella enterica TaxID=28901 RepID=A0A5Z3XF03_SALER|nr:transcriptional regulator [Salmonella enterica]ECH9523205.1 transcriptional regulator [Salmonella enterica subsp. enterica]ECM0247755.1 transcriptional regulator [Salmonella enterica subsp. enterica serovar Muenchen]EAM9869170.1 transcriptional regulator [Salmonella enterica]EAP8846724.1 transcriptional regulator [Salmonella enterica]